MSNVGKAIKAARLKAGVTQSRLAGELGVWASKIANAETKRTATITYNNVREAAVFLGEDPVEWLTIAAVESGAVTVDGLSEADVRTVVEAVEKLRGRK